MHHVADDFEQAILAQVSDKWKPITLADGAFDLDELKRDISTSDTLSSFMTLKSATVKKKRVSDAQVDSHTKRFRKVRQRPLFLLEQDAEEDDEQDDLHDDDGEDVQDPEGAGESDWDFLAF